MEWEIVNGITGIVSAVCAVISLRYLGTHEAQESATSILNTQKFMAFLLASSGWALCCLSYLWLFEPFGAIATDREYQQLFGAILSFPAVVIFMFGMKVLGIART